MPSRNSISRDGRPGQVGTESTPHLSPHRTFRGLWVPFAVVRDAALSPGAKLCYAALAYHAGKRDHCWPSERRLAALLGVSVRQVRRYVAQLVAGGWITVARTPGGSSTYRFILHPAFAASSPIGGDRYVPTTPDTNVRTPRTQMSAPLGMAPPEENYVNVLTPLRSPSGGEKSSRRKPAQPARGDLVTRALELARRLERK